MAPIGERVVTCVPTRARSRVRSSMGGRTSTGLVAAAIHCWSVGHAGWVRSRSSASVFLQTGRASDDVLVEGNFPLVLRMAELLFDGPCSGFAQTELVPARLRLGVSDDDGEFRAFAFGDR